jgi:hypothetical protein
MDPCYILLFMLTQNSCLSFNSGIFLLNLDWNWIYIYINAKMTPVETDSGCRGWNCIRGVGDEGEQWMGWIPSMIYLIYCKNLCEYHNVSPIQYNSKENSLEYDFQGLLVYTTKKKWKLSLEFCLLLIINI